MPEYQHRMFDVTHAGVTAVGQLGGTFADDKWEVTAGGGDLHGPSLKFAVRSYEEAVDVAKRAVVALATYRAARAAALDRLHADLGDIAPPRGVLGPLAVPAEVA